MTIENYIKNIAKRYALGNATEHTFRGDFEKLRQSHKNGIPHFNFYETFLAEYDPKIRKGRTLNFEDILHYQKMIVALTETDRLMREIDEILEV